ncbi:MAG: UDP-2,3-diacylglucosamine diphosphatase [Gammaproteobacteria bacterium]
MTALFISDLHLDASRPAATDCFLRFLAGPARDAGNLYILGDLFEAWTGDDAAGLHEQTIIAAIRRYTLAGGRCGFLRGNRDFLIGRRFATETGADLLDDETCVDLDGTRALLMHGDTLCTDDRAYQRYRRLVHQSTTQALYLNLPVRIRIAIAAYARQRSMAANAGKAAAIMDVNELAVIEALRRNNVQLLIHGHTHRPAVHTIQVDGWLVRRIVLGDWYEQGSVLQWSTAGPDLHALRFS